MNKLVGVLLGFIGVVVLLHFAMLGFSRGTFDLIGSLTIGLVNAVGFLWNLGFAIVTAFF